MIDRSETVAHMRRRLQRGPRECTVCGKEMPPRRVSYCSDECWRMIDWGEARRVAMIRDNATCVLCGFDSNALRAVLRYLDWMTFRALQKHFSSIGFDRIAKTRNWGTGLHVDHIVPVAEGGTHAQDNLRTLCVPCHKQVTREWNGAKAQKRRELT